VVLDAFRCASPIVQFRVNSTDNLATGIQVVKRPCLSNDFTGTLAAVVSGGTGVTVSWFFNDSPTPFVSGNIIAAGVVTGRQAGIYRIEVTSLSSQGNDNCTAVAMTQLRPVNDLVIQAQRTAPEVVNGFITGFVSGGNGPPFTIEALPPDGLNILLEPSADATFFRVENVNPGRNVRLRARDSEGCIEETLDIGDGIPIDIVFETPTETPTRGPDEPKAERDHNNPGLFLMLASLFAMCFLCTFAVTFIRAGGKLRKSD
jgi:hypothetical protein